MRQPAAGSLGLFLSLLSSAVAACSGDGQDGLVTVGIRPTDEGAASGVAAAGDSAGLPTPVSDAMNQTLEGDGAMTPGSSVAGAAGASAGTSASAGSAAAGMAGAGDAGIGAAGTHGSLDPNEDECGAVPSQPAGGVTSGRVSGSGLIEYAVDAPNVFIGLHTTLTVPAEPPPNGHIFVWPGIQPTPDGTDFQPIGNGGLLSVLTWGPSLCPPDGPASYSTWWIAPMYTNLSSSDPRYSGCHTGKVVLATPEHLLDIDTHLDGTTWLQTVVNRDTMEASDFSLDLNGQEQGRLFFAIDPQTSNKPTEDVIFTNTVLSMEISDPDACQPVMRGANDFASTPRVSADGRHCCIDRIVLRAPGATATTMDPPANTRN